MSRPAPLQSRRPKPSTAAVGGTSLGTPLKTRTITESANAASAASASSAAAAAAPATPVRAKLSAASSSPSAASSSSSSAASSSRTPAKTPLRGFGSSVASSTLPAASPASAAAAAAASSHPSPSPPKMISRQRYDSTKASDPFATKAKFKTSFSEAYTNGRIPCRVNHGSVRHTLQWDVPAHELDYDFLLPVMADGLAEVEHPFVTIARKAFAEMVAEGGQAKIAPFIPKLIQPLRRALMDPAAGVFGAGCDAIIALSNTVGPLLNPHIDLLLQQINKKSLNKAFQEKVNECISALASNGGDEALPKIKSKVPGFCV